MWLNDQAEIMSLLSVSLPVIHPPVPFSLSIPFFHRLGTIAIMTTLTTPKKGIICSDIETVNTGIPDETLSLQDRSLFKERKNFQMELERQIQELLSEHNFRPGND